MAALLNYNSEYKFFTFKVYNSVVSTTFTGLRYYYYLIQNTSVPQKETSTRKQSFFTFAEPQATILYFVSRLVCFGHVYERHHKYVPDSFTLTSVPSLRSAPRLYMAGPDPTVQTDPIHSSLDDYSALFLLFGSTCFYVDSVFLFLLNISLGVKFLGHMLNIVTVFVFAFGG